MCSRSGINDRVFTDVLIKLRVLVMEMYLFENETVLHIDIRSKIIMAFTLASSRVLSVVDWRPLVHSGVSWLI